MKTIRMTDRWLRSVSASEGREEYADAIVRGLRLRVSSRSKKWSVMTRIDKKLKRIPIGDAPKIGLLDARERANQILDGDFTEPKAAAPESPPPFKSAPLLETMCADYVARMKKRGQPSHTEYQ